MIFDFLHLARFSVRVAEQERHHPMPDWSYNFLGTDTQRETIDAMLYFYAVHSNSLRCALGSCP